MTETKPTIVDIHTHVYPPSYIDLLASRTKVPYIYRPPNADPRLIILPSDDDPNKPQSQRGRPIDASYSEWTEKLAFMAKHEIDVSVVSLANPWLDWLEPEIALTTARSINDDLERECAGQNGNHSSTSTSAIVAERPTQRLYAFACLPLSASCSEIVSEIRRLKTLPNIKGVILGTTGLGQGLDDPNLEPVWEALSSLGILVFLHPHYGLPDMAFGGPSAIARSGHVLPLALGFPLETTIAVSRMFLAGVFDRHPGLQMLLAHSGGTLPFLAGRIQSCVEHEREFIANGGTKQGPVRDIWDVLQHNIYLDAVIYGQSGLKAAIHASGVDRLMFGTDHPFFPPLSAGDDKWASVVSNTRTIDTVSAEDRESVRKILGGNAARVLGIDP